MQYGLSAFERARGDLPELPVVNMTAEEAAVEADGVVLQSRPGLTDRNADMGSGVDTLFKRDGVLSGALFGVSGGSLYRDTSALGAIAGSGVPSIAGNEAGLIAAAGGVPRYWNGTALADIAFPDSAGVIKVIEQSSRFIAIRTGTQKFYWSPILTPTFAALDFASAETEPDRLLDVVGLDDTLVLFGSETVEFWPNTSDADLPFQPLEGRVYEKGIRATGCATVFDAGIAWVGNDNVVYLGGQKPEPVSNFGLQEKIAASASCALWTFLLDGQEFMALRLDSATYCYGSRNRLWSEFASYDESNWLPRAYAGGVFGCSDGATAAWGTGHLDFDGILERRFRAGFPLNGGAVHLDNVGLRANVGQTPYLVAGYAEPQVEMQVSRDAGQTWGNWRSRALGRQGQYRKKVEWRSLGLASRPGFLAEFRVTAPVPFRVSGVTLNEAYGGR